MAAGEPSQEKEVSVGAGVRFSLHDRAEHFYHGETPFILDGFILGLCLRGSEEIRVNGKTYSVVPGCRRISWWSTAGLRRIWNGTR